MRVKNVPDAKIERPTDVLVKITSTNICGSDLHMYEGRTDMEKGRVLGHENLGQVVEVGEAVDRIKVGDWVCLPFNVACGFCKNCEAGLTGFCLTTNPGTAGAAYGFAGMGPYSGGQAEYLRVPYADFNCLKLPDDAQEKEKSPQRGKVKAWDKTDWGIEVKVDKELANVKPSDYDALVLPGGVMNPDKLRQNDDAVNFVKEFLQSGKPIAAICHGPQILIETGLLKGKTMTSFPSLKTDLRNAGANWVDKEIVHFDNLITSRKPADLDAFNKELIKTLSREESMPAHLPA